MAVDCARCGHSCYDFARFCSNCCAPVVRAHELAGCWARLLAGAIDAAIFGFAAMFFGLAGALAYFDSGFVVGAGMVWISWIAYSVGAFGAGGGIGMQLVGLRLIDARNGGNPGVRRALIRLIVSVPSLWILGLGYLWMLWDQDKQTWHDKAAGTLLVLEFRS